MAEALSQGEIDALLTQTASDDDDVDLVLKKEKAVFTYNFRRQKKFNKNDFVVLEGVHKRFLRSFEITLTNLLSTPVMSAIAAATELSYSDCMDSFSTPTCIYILNINDGKGKFIMEIDPNFAFFVIDRILGGSTKETHTMDRELSLIEEKIMYRVVNFFIQDLIEAWRSVANLKIEIESFYAQPDYVQVLSNSETVILVSMDVRSSEKTLGYMNMCLPSTILERLFQRYDSNKEQLREYEQDSTDRKDIEMQMRKSVLPLKVILGKARMTVKDILNLEEGDVIFLPTRVASQIDVFVGDLRLYKATPVKKDNSMAVMIADVLSV